MGRSRQESIYKRSDGMWIAVLELPSRNGKRRRRTLSATSETAVKQKLKKERRTLEERGDLPTSYPTVEWWFTHYLEKIAPKELRPKSLSGYTSLIKTHVIPEIGKVKLSKLTPDHIRQVHDRILATPKRKAEPDGPKLSPTYTLNAFRIMSRVLKIAEREGKIGRNPCTLMDAPRAAHVDLHALDVAQAKLVLRAAAEALDTPGEYDQWPMLWAYYLLTACRRGEALGLEWPHVSSHIDVSWQLQRIADITRVPADYQYRHLEGNYYLVAVKTQAGNRVIPSVDPLKSLLALHSARTPEGKHGLVFCHEDGSPLDPDVVKAQWDKWLAASGISAENVRLHDLRHTTVDLLYEAGVPEDIIKDIVGHSTRMQTRSYKTRRQDARLTSAMEALSELLA